MEKKETTSKMAYAYKDNPFGNNNNGGRNPPVNETSAPDIKEAQKAYELQFFRTKRAKEAHIAELKQNEERLLKELEEYVLSEGDGDEDEEYREKREISISIALEKTKDMRIEAETDLDKMKLQSFEIAKLNSQNSDIKLASARADLIRAQQEAVNQKVIKDVIKKEEKIRATDEIRNELLMTRTEMAAEKEVSQKEAQQASEAVVDETLGSEKDKRQKKLAELKAKIKSKNNMEAVKSAPVAIASSKPVDPMEQIVNSSRLKYGNPNKLSVIQ